MPPDPHNIAFTDLEMTGVDPLRHEIIEIGLVIADRTTLEVRAELDIKVKPQHLETADPASLAFAGYREEEWKDASPLPNALKEYAQLVHGSIFAAWNAPYDWIFLASAFRKTGIENPLDYHTLDVFSLAFEKLGTKPDANVFRLPKLCRYLDIPKEPIPHRAINGARIAYEVYKKLKALS